MEKITIKIGFLSSKKYKKSMWTDRLIEWWTKGPYFHTEIFIPTDDPKTYKAYTASGRDGHVRVKERYLHPNEWDYIDIELSKEQVETIVKFYDKIMGDKYDWLGILGFILPFKDRDNEWFCSETVANALKIIGDERFWIKDPSNISPNKLAYMLGLLPELNKGNMIKRFIKHVIFNKENK